MPRSAAPTTVWREGVHRWVWRCNGCGPLRGGKVWTWETAVKCALMHLAASHPPQPVLPPELMLERRRAMIREIVSRPDVQRVLARLAPDD